VSAVEVLLEQALVDLFVADAGVQTALGDPVRVKRGDGEAPAYPFLEIIGRQSRPADVTGFAASEHIVDVLVASRHDKGQGGLEAIGAVRVALRDAELALAGWRSVLISPVFTDLTSPSPGYWRAVLRLRIVMEEA